MEVVEALRSTFPGAALATLRSLATNAEVIDVAVGTTLFRQGESAECGYVVVRGRFRAVREDGLVYGEVGRGTFVGEAALLENGARSASMLAIRNSQVAVLRRTDLDALLISAPTAARHLLTIVAQRVANHGHLPATPERVIALLPGAGDDVTALVDAVSPELLRLGSVEVVDADRVTAELRLDPRADLSRRDADRLALWLEALEAADVMLLLADNEWTPWTQRCVSSADRLVVIADASASPTTTAAERAVAEEVPRAAHVRRTLVLVHPSDTAMPSGTAAWLDARDVDNHLHIRRDNAADAARLARALAGTPVALVLAGGGARTFAEIGVYRSLVESGVPVDMVGGTSQGSIIAMGIAMQLDPQAASELAASRSSDLKDFTLPLVSILRGERIWRRLGEVCGELDIEDLWLPFWCTATDLTNSEGVVIRRGSLREAVRASIALPGILPPVDRDGRVLIDGAIVDNMPVRPLRAVEPRATVVAVEVTSGGGPRVHQPFPRSVSGWRLALQRAVPGVGAPRLPSLVRTMMQAVVVGSARDRRDVLAAGLVDLHLDLDLRGHGLLDFEAAAALAESGYRQSIGVVGEWAAGRGYEPTQLPVAPPDRAAEPTSASEPATVPAVHPRRFGAVVGALFLTMRDLQYRIRRFAAAVAGTTVILALLLLMTGLVNQFRREPGVTVDAVAADRWLVRQGASGVFTSAATIDPALAAGVTGVAAADPVVIARHSLVEGDADRDVVVIGHRPGGLGTPPVSRGRAAAEVGEAAVSDVAGLDVGDVARVGGRDYQVVGVVPETSVLAGMPIVYLTLDDAQVLVYGGRRAASAIVTRGTPTGVPPGLTSMTPKEIAEDALRPLERPITTLNIVRGLLWLVAAMIVSTVTFMSAIDRRRDFAVLRAIGSSSRSLALGVASQAVLLGVAAAVLGIALETVAEPLFPMPPYVRHGDRLMLPLAAAGIAAIASYGAIRRTLRIDPASAFAAPGA